MTGITWTGPQGSIGDLQYAYDANSRVIAKSGSLAETGLPGTVGGNTFNAANEMLTFNGLTLTYDANGNLTGDGVNTYAWDSRNQLAGISGSISANFAYDSSGRRAKKTVGGTTTQFLYDGLNPVQELDGNTPPGTLANLLTGPAIDELFTRTDANSPTNLLTDNLGSTIALTDSTGAITSNYSYEPFGKTTAGGASSGNPYQFTGRENDGTGLYYYRARYYNPRLQRFISQDPLDFGGVDVNLYAYTYNRSNRLD